MSKWLVIVSALAGLLAAGQSAHATALDVTTVALPNGQVGVSYSSSISATGGTTPYVWSIVGGSLPAGLTLVPSTGAVTGTPTASGASNFTARVTDNVSATHDQALSIAINPSSGLLAHPRVWLNQYHLNRMRAAKNANSAEWTTLKNWCDSNLGANLQAGYNFLGWYEYALDYGLAFQITGNQSYGNEGVKYLKALMRDRTNVGDALGGATAITTDSGYVARSLGTGVAVGRDWLDGATDLTPAVINECAARLGDWITWYNSNGYARTDPTDNYYAGYFTMVYTASISIEGDSGYQSSWQTRAESMWSTAVQPFMTTGAGAHGNWLQGWNYGQWSAREYLGYPFALETGTTRSNHWSEITWSTDLVKDQIHMLYPSRGFIDDAGCWSGNYKGDPRQGVCQMCTVMSPNSATTKGLALWFTKHLTWSPGGAPLAWEGLMYTDSSVTEVAPTVSNMGGLSYLVYGHGVARSADWSNTSATWVGVESEPIDGQGESGLHSGEVKIGSRSHILLIDGRTYEYTSDLANVPDITGSHLYAPLQEWWHDAVTFNMDNDDSAYTYFKTTGLQSCYDGQNGENPDATYFTRDVTFMRPDFVAVFDNITTASTANAITEKWFTAGQPTINGATASITLGSAKLFTRTVNPSVSVTSAANGGSRTPAYDPNEGFSGVYKLLVSPSAASTSNNILQLFETADSTQGSMTAYDKLTPAGFLGVSIKHAINPKVVLFATAHNPAATSCSFSFTPVASPTKVLLIGMHASTSFSVTVTDGSGGSKNVAVATGSGYTSTANGALSFDVISAPTPLQITTTSLSNGVISFSYAQTLSAVGGLPPYTWSISGGSLPAGLSLNASSGLISGTPTASGTANFTIRVSDSQATPATDQKALSLAVDAAPLPLTITTESLPSATSGSAYSQMLTATGGIIPYTWSLAGGALPSGLSLNTSTGAISGTPTGTAVSSFTVRVADSQSSPWTDQKALSITVDPAPLSIVTTSLPNATTEAAYLQTVTATGGVLPYAWSIPAGSLPAGLSLNASTGAISGTPTASGTSSFTVRVTDSQGTPATDEKALSIVVDPAPPVDPVCQQTASDAEASTTSTDWQTAATLAFTQGTADTYLILAFAEYQGDPSYATSVRFQIDAATEGLTTMMPASASEYIPFASSKVTSIAAGPHTMTVDYCSSNSLGTSRIRRARIIAIRKGALEVHSAASDAETGLPATLTDLATTTFTPASRGDYLLIFTAESMGQWSWRSFIQTRLNGMVLDEGQICARADINFDSFASFCVANLPASSQTVALSGYKEGLGWQNIRRCRVAAIRLSESRLGSFAWAASDSASPSTSTTYVEKLSKTWTSGASGNWLVLSSGRLNSSGYSLAEARTQFNNTDTLSTTSRVMRTTNEWKNCACVGVEAIAEGPRQTDVDFRSGAGSDTATVKYSHAVMLPVDSTAADLAITTASLPGGTVGVAYNQVVAVIGGTPLYTWSIAGGSLPAGLTLDGATGTISGTPTVQGVSNFTIQVTDSATPAGTVNKALSISVSGGPMYQFAASDSETSTTNTNYVGKVSMTVSPLVTDDWIIFGFCEFKCPNPAYATFVQLFIDGTGEGQNTRKPVDPTDYLPFISVKVKNLAPGAHTVQLKYRAGNAAAAAYVRNARVCAVRKANLEFWNVANDNAKPLTISSTDIAMLTWTPATTGNYLVISTAELNATTTVSTDLQTLYNGVLNDEGIMRAADNGDYTTFMSFNYCANAPAGVPIIHKIAGRKMASDPINHYIRRARILALRLSQGRFNNTAAGSATEQNTTAITFQQCLTTSWTYGVNGNWLFLNSARVNNSSTSYQTGVRVQLNNTYTCGDQLMRPKDVTDLLNYSSIDIRSLTTPRTVDMDWRTTNSSGTAKVKRLRFYGLPLDAQ